MSVTTRLILLVMLCGARYSFGSHHDNHLTMMLSGSSTAPQKKLAASPLKSKFLPQTRKSPDETQAEAVRDLLSRLLPSHASLFHVEVDSSLAKNYFDTVQVVSPLPDGTEGVSVSGSGGVAAAWGILNYLKYHCNCHISWEADQLDLPSPLPEANFAITAKDKVRYYQNVCTVSYTSVWWDWPRWEREIDWMALNGINLPLAFTGQEAVWRRVYLKLGLTDKDLEQFFSGPAFLAWQRMGNLMAWGGPLPLSWIEAQEELQKKILKRMRELGITPVLPCFSGNVPSGFQRVYPDAKVTRMSSWGGFNDTYTRTFVLAATDPMYSEIGTMFIEEMIDTYGYTDGFYNCDPFNEQKPDSESSDYISGVAGAIYKGLRAADPDAIWVVQGWMLLDDFWTVTTARHLFKAVEKGRILALDLAAANSPVYDRFESFFGQPFVFCMLHNFGGTDGLNGFTGNIVKRLGAARKSKNSMVGTGLSMEGIDQNYIMYDLMMELAWKDIPHDVIAWARQYSTRRYGSSDVAKAFDHLMPHIYNNVDPTMQFYHGHHALVLRPSLTSHLKIWYPMKDLVDVWDEMVAAANTSLAAKSALIEQKTFQHDLVDVSREILQDLGALVVEQILQEYNYGSASNVKSKGKYLTELLLDLDSLLATSPDFLLGRWTESAAAWATTKKERELYVYNALNQVTLWGPEGHGPLDYANKQWSGMVSQYYLPRWKHFVKELLRSLASNDFFDQERLKRFFLENIEKPFTFNVNKKYSSEPTGNAVKTALRIYTKYRPQFEADGFCDLRERSKRSTGDQGPSVTESRSFVADFQGGTSALHYRPF